MQFLKKVGFILWFIILFIWQLPQNLVALVMLPFLGKLRLISFKKMNFCFEGSNMMGGISLGTFSYVSKSLAKRKANVKHEQEGHTVDSKRWGPLYIFVIGIPSILWAGFGDDDKCYYSFYTERWANKHANLEVVNPDTGRCYLKDVD